MALLALQNFAKTICRFHGGVVIVTIASIRAVAARTGVPRWPRGAVRPQGVPCYGLVMKPRQPAYNRRVAPGPKRTHCWLFYAILEVGARTSPLLYHGPKPRPPAGRPQFHGVLGGLPRARGILRPRLGHRMACLQPVRAQNVAPSMAMARVGSDWACIWLLCNLAAAPGPFAPH